MKLRRRLDDFRRRHPRLVRAFLLVAIFGVAFVAGLGYASWALVCRGGACPSVGVLDEYTPRQTSKLYAADGRFIAEIGLERRTLIRLDEIPASVREAFVTTEDKRFYSHAGVDWSRVPGAVLANVKARAWRQGFSTITMQLAGNIFTERISRRDKSVVRKLKEVKVARQIESQYPKDKILELYLNQIYLGSGAYGVETAAQRYFGKSVRDVNLAEASMLAALAKGPERYNPRRYPDRAIQRRNTIIELMRREEVISDGDASLAKAYPLQLARRSESGDVAPYFVEWIRKQLDDQFGQQLYEQGLRVFTTLDLDMQAAAERSLEQQLRAIEGGQFGRYGHTTYEEYMARAAGGGDDGPNSPYLQGAMVAMDPRTGAVRALIGGRNFDDSKFNRATQALRQPGSTFKPIVYAAAIQNGRPPSYIINDAPVSVPQLDGTNWEPQNYDEEFHGPMTMRQGLYQSRNLVAVNMGMELGEPTIIDEARKFGLTTPIPPYPAITLGSADVYPIEMVASYSAFATLGVRASPIGILRVENARGEVLWEPTPVRAQVLSPEEAWLMVDMMKDVVQRGTAWGSVWNAGFRIPSGGKTGTTNDGTDVWYIGYTADLVAGVWMGLDRPQRIKTNAQGGILAAPAWTGFMKEVYTRKPAPPDWPRPESIISREVDKMTGLSRNPFCPTELVYTEHYIPGTEPIRECDAHSPFSIFGDTGSTLAPDTTGQGGVRITPGVVPIPRPSRPAIPDSLNPFHIPTTPEPVTPAPANPGPAAPSPAPSAAPDRAPFVPSETERPAGPPPR